MNRWLHVLKSAAAKLDICASMLLVWKNKLYNCLQAERVIGFAVITLFVYVCDIYNNVSS